MENVVPLGRALPEPAATSRYRQPLSMLYVCVSGLWQSALPTAGSGRCILEDAQRQRAVHSERGRRQFVHRLPSRSPRLRDPQGLATASFLGRMRGDHLREAGRRRRRRRHWIGTRPIHPDVWTVPRWCSVREDVLVETSSSGRASPPRSDGRRDGGAGYRPRPPR